MYYHSREIDTNAWHIFQRLLRRLHESATAVDIPPPPIELKASSVNDLNKTTLSESMDELSAVKVDFSSEQTNYPSLAPLKKIPSVLRAVNAHEIDASDSEAEEEKRDDSFDTKHRQQAHGETSTKSPRKTSKTASVTQESL